MSNIYSIKLENKKLYIKINNTDNENYARIGQIIFQLKDENNKYITNNVFLSGSFTNALYYPPNFNGIVLNNWTVTKKAGTITPTLPTNNWIEILTVPSNTKKIEVDKSYKDMFGHSSLTYWCYVEGSLPISMFSEPGISNSQIEIIN
tara:strand:+ start:134 stop:577 length:444 start_codon:yes stop_codon:yes gene_type:complete